MANRKPSAIFPAAQARKRDRPAAADRPGRSQATPGTGTSHVIAAQWLAAGWRADLATGPNRVAKTCQMAKHQAANVRLVRSLPLRRPPLARRCRGYLIVLAMLAALQLIATRTRSRIPSLGETLSRVMSTRTGRVGMLVAWAWLGLHFFAK